MANENKDDFYEVFNMSSEEITAELKRLNLGKWRAMAAQLTGHNGSHPNLHGLSLEGEILQIVIIAIRANKGFMLEEADFIKSILPEHYTCQARINGVHCVSSIGISDDGVTGDETWQLFLGAVRKKFGNRFMEVDHNVLSDHVNFNVYLKPVGGE